ncbi:2'-5' RNA ligase family protein [Pseudorhodoferax sp. Leaf267]|uniref:2'-5' RNA ligase family protein n=1 Tax=Pseudorhodoferax sp. Leaf267 TaxID=1736316 RepID=UPI0006F4ABA2|nr:2'-5' RNA ligase family protein [Pseudorhodoferax sp. Leaf267]KQP22669.1 hypothetical protein ASF43_01790 [Pseudorhodoferax sp. Leaf267]
MAKPSPDVCEQMQRILATEGWDRQLGEALFDAQNWHQSLSHPLPYSDALRNRLLDIGSRIDAAAFTTVLNRVRGSGLAGQADAIHWAFHATRPPAFDALVKTIRDGLQTLGLEGMPGHSPHVTISYWAPTRLAVQKIAPIAWRIEELLLVETCSSPYRDRTLASWPLRPVPAGLESQRELW